MDAEKARSMNPNFPVQLQEFNVRVFVAFNLRRNRRIVFWRMTFISETHARLTITNNYLIKAGNG